VVSVVTDIYAMVFDTKGVIEARGFLYPVMKTYLCDTLYKEDKEDARIQSIESRTTTNSL